ncbi:SUMF1/EgtB/PvdO family nonheme iron enzyme [Nostoc punctiforme FACHB-252]|uniref:SUMF1/EgtB/PvdO family nonheme iron enzyme n=2 Tax=Nostoc punctiforme TaxID=272131 RepID=A0ABR8HMD9_NOSPU|nr:SUMF1/EgtB/PvdO family nonheme iron enzyme [Nostoc punctiforme FACHB-252]
MSGLLKRLPVSHQDDTEYITYEFVDGVRELLRDFVPPNKQISVIDLVIAKISEFIAKRLGISIKEFEAQIFTHNDDALASKVRPFAKLKAQVLRQLGGKYVLEAEKLELSQFLQTYTGEYICAVKWGGETGIWQQESEPERLLISPQGEVQFRSRFGLAVIQNLNIEGQTLSWSFDNNQTAASITFKENSQDKYFWEDNQTGKLFEGWLNYPNEGRIDFRGRLKEISVLPPFQPFEFKVATITFKHESFINLQPFEFEVAIITRINESDITDPIETVDNLVFSQTEKHLNEIEQLILQETILGLTFDEMAASSNYSKSQLRDIADNLWKVLSVALGKKVNKTNLKKIIKQQINYSQLDTHRSFRQAQHFMEDLGDGVQLEMVQIPSGEFMMGATKNEKDSNDDERPQHQVTVPAFFMGKYPVTQAQWQAVASLPQVNREIDPDPSTFKGKNRPVESVSWYDAVEFCDRLFHQTGKSYSLPSEAEWEYACRAGTTTPFHFGEIIVHDLANYDANYTYGFGVKGVYRKETTPVGNFSVANAFGLYDMHGNLWEWCADQWHENYEGAPSDGSVWLNNSNNNNYRLQRGGSWNSSPVKCRAASRNYNFAGERLLNVGFRVALSITDF